MSRPQRLVRRKHVIVNWSMRVLEVPSAVENGIPVVLSWAAVGALHIWS